ncbi:305_t:CDS:10, partial [Paraglomus occultum]
SGESSRIIASSFEDDSTYVVKATTKVLLSIIANSQSFLTSCPPSNAQDKLLDHLVTSLDLFRHIDLMLFDSTIHNDRRLAALELVWSLASSRRLNSVEFLRRCGHLLHINKLLRDPNRIIRARVVEILSVILEWVPDPLLLLKDESSTSSESNDCVVGRSDIALPLITQADNLDSVTTSVEVLVSLNKLILKDSANNRNYVLKLLNILNFILDLVLAEQKNVSSRKDEFVDVISSETTREKLIGLLNNGKRSAAYRKTLVISLLNAIRVVALDFSDKVLTDNCFSNTLIIISRPSYNTDHRVLKAGLSVISIVLSANNDGIDYKTITDKVIRILLEILTNTSSEPRGIASVLETIATITGNPNVREYLTNSSYATELVACVRDRCKDIRWDVRDSCLEFLKQLIMVEGCSLSLMSELIEEVLIMLSDPESYVRASSLSVIQALIRSTLGWNYLTSNNLQYKIASMLPKILDDTETFVRRAVMELLISLIVERQCKMIILSDHNKEIMNPEKMSKLVNDPDFEVRIRVIQFLHVIWDHCEFDRMRINKKFRGDQEKNESMLIDEGEEESWFYWLKGDSLLVSAADDSSRLVRKEILKVLNILKSYLEPIVATYNSQTNGFIPSKRPTDSENLIHKHYTFYHMINNIDFSRLAATIDVEHLYQEALECVDSSVM